MENNKKMGISNYTALLIANNPHVKADVGGEEGKYVGWIFIEESEETRYQPLLNTKPIYKTKEEALEAMQKTIDEIKCNKKEHIKQLSRDITTKAIKAGIKDGSYN